MNNKDKLTNREIELLYLIVEGKSNPQIANSLTISIHTVKAHIENIYRKLKVRNKVEASIYAIRARIIDINKIKTSQNKNNL